MKLKKMTSEGRAIMAGYSRPRTNPMPSGDVDILLPLGPGSTFENFELRMALRSIERHAVGWRRIVIIGTDPGFLLTSHPRLRFYPMEEFGGNYQAKIAQKVTWAFREADMTQHVGFWNDDYVLLEGCDVRKIPFHYDNEIMDRVRLRKKGPYTTAMQRTHDLLDGSRQTTFHFDIHVPIIYERERWLALERWWKQAKKEPHGLTLKSVYGNVNKLHGPPKLDMKLLGFEGGEFTEQRLLGRWIFSYNDAALDQGLSKLLLRWFPGRSTFEAR